MFLTSKFIFIHLPKTGGTFVEAMLGKLHNVWLQQLPKRIARKAGLPVTVELAKHGTWLDIPVPYRERPVLTCVRHPLDLYVSQYKFNRFRQHPNQFGGANPRIMERWPNYPDLSFDEYVRFSCEENTLLRFPGFSHDDQPGMQTQHFLYFFGKNRNRIAFDLNEESAHNGTIQQFLAPNIHYLFTHDLNRGLYDYLVEMGYSPKRLQFILDSGRVMPEGGGRKDGDHWSHYYTPELEAYVRRKEQLLFDLFPQFEEWEKVDRPAGKAADVETRQAA